MRNNIKDFYGAVVGYTEVDARGDVTAHDRYGKILGTFKKDRNVTVDFYGRILANGDITSSLVWDAERKRKEELSKTR
jgi:hypothetical protein